MPLYEDVEAKAFFELREMEIPPPLALIGTCPLGVDEKAAQEIGQGACLKPHKEGVDKAMVTIKVPAFDGIEPPVLPHEVSRDFGLMLFDDRYVEGQPSDAAVDRLLEIEEQILARATKVAPKPPDNPTQPTVQPTGLLPPQPAITLTVTYYGGPHQPKLDAMLRSRNRHTLPVEQKMRPPWWQFWRFFGRIR
jgi:hypothetical protein